MKTRKYKDNQQRKNFAKNESNILLIQYFKGYAFGSEAFKKVSGTNVSNATRSEAKLSGNFKTSSLGLISKPEESLNLPLHHQKFDYKKWDNFKYPDSLSNFFSERPSLKSGYFLMKLKDQINEKSFSETSFAINDLAFKICYSKKVKQKQNKSRIRGRCIQSNRPRSVSRLLRLSRIRTRTLALDGKITGCTRSTW